MMVHSCNFSTGEAEAGELQVGGQPGLYHKTPSKKWKERMEERETGREKGK
jgi:hypothetical protein